MDAVQGSSSVGFEREVWSETNASILKAVEESKGSIHEHGI